MRKTIQHFVKKSRQPGKRQRPFRNGVVLRVEQLEGRVVPSTVVLNPSKDNTLYQSVAGDISNGAGPSFFAGETGGMGGDALRRGVIVFDEAGHIPAGAISNGVTLCLPVFRQAMGGGAQPVELHRLSA